MGILAWRFFYDYFTNPIKVIIASLLFCSLYGVTDEWHQFFVIGRDASFLDWFADTIGALIAISILYNRVEKTNSYF
jgi:VanZ family protein